MQGLDLIVALASLVLLYSSARTVASKRDVSLAARRRAKGSLALFLSLALLVLEDFHWVSGGGTRGVSLVLLAVAAVYFVGSMRAGRSTSQGN